MLLSGYEVTRRFNELIKDRERAREFYRRHWASIFFAYEPRSDEEKIISNVTSMIIKWLISTAEFDYVDKDYDWRNNSNLITIEKYFDYVELVVGEIGYDISTDKRIIVVE